jgi:hypothetical protein
MAAELSSMGLLRLEGEFRSRFIDESLLSETAYEIVLRFQ